MFDPVASNIALGEIGSLLEKTIKIVKLIKNARKTVARLTAELERHDESLEDVRNLLACPLVDEQLKFRLRKAVDRYSTAISPLLEKLIQYCSSILGKTSYQPLRGIKETLLLPELEKRIDALEKPLQSLHLAVSTFGSRVLLQRIVVVPENRGPDSKALADPTISQNEGEDVDAYSRARWSANEFIRMAPESLGLDQLVAAYLDATPTVDLQRRRELLSELSNMAESTKGNDERLEDMLLVSAMKRNFGPKITLRIPGRLKSYILQLKYGQDHFGCLSFGFHLQFENEIPESSPIFQACADNDLNAVRELFTSKQASPYDVDVSGRSLIHYATYERVRTGHSLDKRTVLLVKQLVHAGTNAATGILPIIKCHRGMDDDLDIGAYFQAEMVKKAHQFGNDRIAFGSWWFNSYLKDLPPSPWVDELRAMDPETLAEWAYIYCRYENPDEFKQTELFNRLASFCIETAISDPFDNTNICMTLWQRSGFGDVKMPLEPHLLIQSQWPLLESLFEEDPESRLNDIVHVGCCSFHPLLDDLFARYLECKYKATEQLCASGILDRQLPLDPSQPSSVAMRGQSLRNRLIGLLMVEATIAPCCKRRKRHLVRRHFQKMLNRLLVGNETPPIFHIIKEPGADSGPFIRSLACLAAEGCLLDAWRAALGRNGNDIVDSWIFSGLDTLFNFDFAWLDETHNIGINWHCPQCQHYLISVMRDEMLPQVEDRWKEVSYRPMLGSVPSLWQMVFSVTKFLL